jgi:hypothetical protein
MLAPIDKIECGGNDIIQIVITTACNLRCSNCSQLLPFRKDYRHMTLDCFDQAVQSVREWPGVVALFGGNPCSHPQFDQLCQRLEDTIPDQRRRGLWSNALLGKGDIARRTFYPSGRFNLNAHGDVRAAAEMDQWLPGKRIPGTERSLSWHAAILADYRDFGISDDDWIRKREACAINRQWSGAIVERDGRPYGYFCEVAAALDGVRGRNHGIPAVDGWWRGRMPAFEKQVGACCDAGCGVPLRMRGHLDRDAVYDISASYLSLTAGRPHTSTMRHREPGASCDEVTDYARLRTVSKNRPG